MTKLNKYIVAVDCIASGGCLEDVLIQRSSGGDVTALN